MSVVVLGGTDLFFISNLASLVWWLTRRLKEMCGGVMQENLFGARASILVCCS